MEVDDSDDFLLKQVIFRFRTFIFGGVLSLCYGISMILPSCTGEFVVSHYFLLSNYHNGVALIKSPMAHMVARSAY